MKAKLLVLCILLTGGALLAFSNGCGAEPSEGATCNALVVDNECINNTTCQTIGSCTATYCCPADPTTSTDPHCNGSLCPPLPPDGGDDDAAPDATDAAPEAASDAGTD